MSEFSLYWNIVSQPARAVKSLIDIGKLPCQFHHIELFKGEQRKKEFLDMYPIGKVPLLKAGEFVLGESGAIMIYLCERYPHLVPYYGETLQQRAITNQYVSWYQNFFRPFMVGPLRLFLNALFTKKAVLENQQKTLLDGMMDVLEKFNELLARNRTKFIAGEKLTIADLLFFHEMTNMVYFGLEHDKYREVKRWYTEVYNVPEVKAITHEWYQTAKQVMKQLQKVEVIKGKPKL